MNRVQKENLKHRRFVWVAYCPIDKVVNTVEGPMKLKAGYGLGTLNKKRLIQQNLLPLPTEAGEMNVNSKTW